MIRLDAGRLERKRLILPGSMSHEEMGVRPDGTRYVPMYLPAVEAWYTGNVPCDAFLEYLAFRRRSNFHFEPVGPDEPIAYLEKLDDMWRQDEERETAERRARGEVTLEEMLERSSMRE